MSKHSPGPWTTDGRYIKAADGRTVADCRYRNAPNDTPLLAAAPELLEALKAVVHVADRKTAEFDAARAAIAKAEAPDEARK